MGTIRLHFSYRDAFGFDPPDAYERLLFDCMHGDQTLFIRHDDMAVAWALLTPVLESWRDRPEIAPLRSYAAGTWGPKEADELLARSDRRWHVPVLGSQVESEDDRR